MNKGNKRKAPIFNFNTLSKKNTFGDTHVQKKNKNRDYQVTVPISSPDVVNITRFQDQLSTSRSHEGDDGFDDFQPMKQRSGPIMSSNQTTGESSLSKQRQESLVMPRRSTAADNDPFRTDHPSDKNKLTLPKKIAKTPETPVLLKRIVKTDLKQDEDAYCPYCGERFALLTEPLKNAIQAIKDKDREYEKKQNDEVEKQNEKSVYSLPTNLTIKRRVSSIDKDAFCKLHRLELNIKPEGRKKGYPREIDFDKLGKRVMRYKDELDLVIADKLPSDYRTLAEDSYREMGSNKARSTMGVMTRFEATLPGYYGPKGAAVILDVLTEHYLKSGYLAQHLVSPQMPLEFLQQVLVPEVGFRLIQSDMLNQKGVVENAREKAKQIMDQSREYGNYMFPVKDQDIESHDIESYPSTSILDSEEDSETEEIHSVGDTKDEQLYDSE